MQMVKATDICMSVQATWFQVVIEGPEALLGSGNHVGARSVLVWRGHFYQRLDWTIQEVTVLGKLTPSKGDFREALKPYSSCATQDP